MSASFEEIKRHLIEDLHMEITDEELQKLLNELQQDGYIAPVDEKEE